MKRSTLGLKLSAFTVVSVSVDMMTYFKKLSLNGVLHHENIPGETLTLSIVGCLCAVVPPAFIAYYVGRYVEQVDAPVRNSAIALIVVGCVFVNGYGLWDVLNR